MEINTTINIDMDNLANELEDFIREIAQDQMNGNEPCFQDDDDVQAMINDALTDAEILNAGDVEQLFADTFLDLRNEVGKLRRSVHVLLEERERSIKKRAERAIQATTRTFSDMVRKVHWHMPRR